MICPAVQQEVYFISQRQRWNKNQMLPSLLFSYNLLRQALSLSLSLFLSPLSSSSSPPLYPLSLSLFHCLSIYLALELVIYNRPWDVHQSRESPLEKHFFQSANTRRRTAVPARQLICNTHSLYTHTCVCCWLMCG